MASTKPGLRVLKTVFYVMLAGQLFFALATMYFIDQATNKPTYILGPNEDLYGLIAHAIVMVMLAQFMDKTRTRSAENLKRTGGNSVQHYLMTVIVRLALLEGAAFMILTFILLTQNQNLYWVLLPILGAFWMAKPSEDEFQFRYT